MKFYASVRIDIRRKDSIKINGAVVGNRVKVKIVKNKVAPPFRETEFDIIFGRGISKEGDILDLAVAYGLVAKSGAWYAYNGQQIGQGREGAKAFLWNNPGLMEELSQKILACVMPKQEPVPNIQTNQTIAGPQAGQP